MRYLVIDGALSGTGIRDYYEGGYIDPQNLGLSDEIVKRLEGWLSKYADEHYNGFKNSVNIEQLDTEGKAIALIIKNELCEVKVEYFSDARLTKILI